MLPVTMATLTSLSPPHELTDCGVAAQHEENIAACVSGCISPNKQDARNARCNLCTLLTLQLLHKKEVPEINIFF